MWSEARGALGAAVFATICFSIWCSAAAFAQEPAPCRSLSFEGDAFTVCTGDPKTDDVRLFLKRPDGTPYGALGALPSEGLLFATNAGMFTPEFAPAGLYVEGGTELRGLNRVVNGYGNFHMQPNGVFWIKDGTAHVTATAAFAELTAKPDVATQSGPMLVIDGKVNAKFEPDGSSRYVRNGIGVDGDGRVIVAISSVPVSFGRFGRLFQSALRCANALYLDGSVSQLRVGGAAAPANGRTLGPLLGVYRRAP